MKKTISVKIFALLFMTFSGLNLALADSTVDQGGNVYQVDTYFCGPEAQEYALVRHFYGDANERSWEIVGICDPGILQQRFYEANSDEDVEDKFALAHKDVQSCQKQEGRNPKRTDLRSCRERFRNEVGRRGVRGQRISSIRERLPSTKGVLQSSSSKPTQRFKEAFKPYTNQ